MAQDLFDLTGKVAVVTGGSRGLGREMVLAFAEHGADVVIASRKLDNCEAVADEVRGDSAGARCPSPTTRRSWAGADELAEAAYAEFGRVDVLVNNAGMSPLYPSVDAITEDLYDKVMGVNLKGPFRLSAIVGTRMAAGRRRFDHLRLVGGVAAAEPGRARLRRGQGRRQQPHVRPGAHARAEGARQLHRARPVPDRHLQGVGPRGVQQGRQAAVRARRAASRTRSSAPRCTSPATPAPTPPARR